MPWQQEQQDLQQDMSPEDIFSIQSGHMEPLTIGDGSFVVVQPARTPITAVTRNSLDKDERMVTIS
jgi:hypothetical protein